jgi:hypothetical protein
MVLTAIWLCVGKTPVEVREYDYETGALHKGEKLYIANSRKAFLGVANYTVVTLCILLRKKHKKRSNLYSLKSGAPASA